MGFIFAKVTQGGKVKGTLNWQSAKQISIQALLLITCIILGKFLNFSCFSILVFKVEGEGWVTFQVQILSDSTLPDTNLLLLVEEELELSVSM